MPRGRNRDKEVRVNEKPTLASAQLARVLGKLSDEGFEEAVTEAPWKSVRPFKVIFCHDLSEFESYMPSHAVRSPSAKMRVVPTLPIHWRVVECLGGLEAMAIIPVALPLQRSRAVRSPQRPSIMSLTSWAGSQEPLMFNYAVLRRPASCFDRRIRCRLPRRQLRPLPLCSRGPSCEPIRRPFPCQDHTQGSNARFRVSLRNRKS